MWVVERATAPLSAGYAEIARRLVISVNTVRYHIKSLYGKLGATSRTQAVARARALMLT